MNAAKKAGEKHVNVMLPTPLKKPGNVCSVHAFANFSVAVCADGSVWNWGSNSRGQLGHASKPESLAIPTKVANLTQIRTVAPGTWHCLALDNAGRVFSAGNNKNGELGRDGGTTSEFM